MRIRILLSAAVLLLAGMAAPGSAAASSAVSVWGQLTDTTSVGSSLNAPTDPQQEIEADRPVPVPATPSCSVALMSGHDFAFSYGAPFVGTYTPPTACPGPWSRVVLTLTSTVGGVQFDRDVYVAVGGAVLLDGTTSEPCCSGRNTVSWSVQRDVSGDAALFERPQPVVVQLDNVVDATYTGVYHTTATLTFYRTSAVSPAAPAADVVIPVSGGSTHPMLSIGTGGQVVGATASFPRNLVRLGAEVFADAHGPCEEFWWSDPSNCAGTPYREVAVYLDGALAGAAPAYPVTYTGADGPGLWEPIPSPRAWNLRPYALDLTPYAGTLTDGATHRIDIGVLDATLGGGDFWAVAANLFGWVDHGIADVTGALTATGGAALPADAQSTDPSGQGVSYADTASHTLVRSGWVRTSTGVVTTTVTESMGEQATQAGAAGTGAWTWDTRVETNGNGHGKVALAHSTYGATTSALTSFGFDDSGTTQTSSDGARTGWSSSVEDMGTAGPTGLAFNGVEHERYGYADSAGTCYDRSLQALGGSIVVDQNDASCPAAPPG